MKGTYAYTSIPVIAATLFIYVLALPCSAQPTIAAALQNNFKSLTTGCFGESSYSDKFLPAGLLSHPMAQEKHYKKLSNISFGALATLVYERQDIGEAITAAGSRFLQSSNVTAQNVTANSDFTSLTYRFSCVSALKTALSAGLNPSPLFGKALNIQAGLNAELNNNSNTGLLVLYGRFRSPLSMMLQDSNPEARMSAYSAIWKYYALNKAPQNPAYLDFLEGWFVTSTTAKEAADSLAVDADTSVQALVLNADWSGSASVKYSSSFKSQTFDMYIVPKPGGLESSYNYHMYALPKPDSIAREIEQNSVIYPSDVAEIISGQLTPFKVAIAGIDSQFCNTAQWDVSIPPPASVITSSNSMDTSGKVCVINMTLQLPPSLSGVSSTPIKLVNNHYPVNGSSIEFKKFIKYRNATYPIAHLSDLPKLQLSGSKNISVALEVPIAIEVAAGVPSPSDIKVTQATLDCRSSNPAKPQLPITVAMVYAYVPQPVPAIRSVFSYSRAEFPDAACTWSGLINFTYNGFSVIGKQISVPLSLDRSQLPIEAQ